MTTKELKKKYLDFFSSKGHAVIPEAPIVPEGDPTTLFTSSGMQQLVPYLKGQEHPMGKRLVNSQPCIRAEDIEEIGDNRHTTYFEMLGNWSLGDYFKEEQLSWFWEFITEELGLEKARIHVTLFEGNDIIEKDEESYKIWKSLGVEDDHIHWYPAEKNWWSRSGTPKNMPEGEIGGPDSEVFFDLGEKYKLHGSSNWSSQECHVNCDCGRYLEIGNSVFMQYEKVKGGKFTPLPNKNVDFGGGLERLVAATEETEDVFTIDVFSPLIAKIEEDTGKSYEDSPEPMRVIADHMRAAVAILEGGVEPSNKKQGYVARRLLRRSAVKLRELNEDLNQQETLSGIAELLLVDSKTDDIKDAVKSEINKFSSALKRGLKEIEKIDPEKIDAKLAFDLYQSYGFPFEITQEILKNKGVTVEKSDFEKEVESHKKKSRTSSSGMFKGGLEDESENTTRLHTATHLLHQALREVLGEEVTQSGSNITTDRLRFDYTYKGSPTEKDLEKVEKLINEKIEEDLKVTRSVEDKEKAMKSGALAFFREKYADKVSVYTIGKSENDFFSKELCGGPHVNSTGDIGGVRIKKEESIGAGKRRVYAVLK